jgi:hypothetical protein
MAAQKHAAASGPLTPTGVTKSNRWFCDVFTGTPRALIAAGIINAPELLPQRGRTAGRTAFLPDGQPCPLNCRAWRDPGYKVLLDLGDGSYSVEVTVPKDVQAQRRKAEQAAQRDADHQSRQLRIDEELAKNGHELRNWVLIHRFGEWGESWEGTKSQLQAEGLGVGMLFPGESGAPERVHCKCPLGFDVRISIPTHEPVKAAAGIFEAHSQYVPLQEREPEPPQQIAPGVLLDAWPEWSTGRDTYVGTGEALVAAGLVPSASLLPGQPGQPKVQVTYTKQWGRCPAGHRESWGATIQKRGTKKFSLQLRVSDEETRRREEIVAKRRKETKEREVSLANERRELRGIASAKVKGVEEFRAERMRLIETDLEFIWRALIKPEGALRFDISENSQHWNDLAEAFETIREVAESAEVIVDRELQTALETRLKLTAARNDKGVQSLLHGAKHLRLVHSTSGNEQG